MIRFAGPVAALALSALTGGLLAPAGAAAPAAAAAVPPAQVQAPVPVLDWEPCEDEFGDGVECATATVPLDYDEPTGETVDLDLTRVPAGDPAQRIGTLFVNPGGPGGSSRWFAAFFGQLVPREVSERFDVVGVDPRGVGPSAPMRCRSDERQPPYPRAFFPTNERQVVAQIRFDRWVRQACAEHPSRIVGHMSTADTARDMDLIRQAVGDELLTYYGISYGTQLGSTYAAMFPDRIRAMVVDGVLNPVAWTTGRGGNSAVRPFSDRLASGHGAWQSLTAAFAECDRVGPGRCPIAGHATEYWRDVLHRLRRHAFRGTTYDAVVGSALGTLYDQHSIPFLMREIKRLHRAMFDGGDRRAARAWDGTPLRARADGMDLVPGPYGSAGFGRTSNPFAGVACADSDNPASERAWERAGIRSDRRSPWFGRLWTWASSVCASWPAETKEDRFAGPFATTTSNPVLVVGNTYDPATPLHGARAVNRLLEGSRLLVMNGWGHGALATGPCVNRAYRDYLVDQVLPQAGAVCRPAGPLFRR